MSPPSASSGELPDIPTGATIMEWQNYVRKNVLARGWDRASDLEVFLLFSEEVGEFAKAFRRYRKLFAERVIEDRAADLSSVDDSQAKAQMSEELADILSYLLDLAGRLDIDLEAALIQKEEINRTREWD